MNWNSIVRSTSAFAVYMAVMGAYIASLSPVAFALYLAVILSLGVLAQSMNLATLALFKSDQPAQSVFPSINESMAELHSLQNEINKLQVQFSNETSAIAQRRSRDGFAG